MMPPPHPGVVRPKPKTPKWVWFLAGAAILFFISLYAALAFGWRWVQQQQRNQLAGAYPEFELVYFNNAGKLRMRHKRTGREFLFDPKDQHLGLAVSKYATAPFENAPPLPAWLKLEEAKVVSPGEYLVEGEDAYRVHELVQEVLEENGYIAENWRRDHGVNACDHKTLTCLVVDIPGGGAASRTKDPRTIYKVRQTRVP